MKDEENKRSSDVAGNETENNIDVDLTAKHPPTNYLETLTHLFKAYAGAGVFGMADAVKHSGILVGGFLTLLIAVICVHVQHILVNASEYQMQINKLEKRPDYALTLELCFKNSRSEMIRRLAPFMEKSCNFMICLTQLGFCSVYFVFVSSNIKNVLDYHGYVIDIHILMLYLFVPIWLTALVRQLKFMGEWI